MHVAPCFNGLFDVNVKVKFFLIALPNSDACQTIRFFSFFTTCQWYVCFAKCFVVETHLSYWRAPWGSSVIYFPLLSILSEKFCKVFLLVSNIHPLRRNLVTLAFRLTYTLLRDFVKCFASLVTYIRWGRILLLEPFRLTYTLLRDFVKCFASSVTYIRQGGILLLKPFRLTYTLLRDFVKCFAPSVTYIRRGGILLL